MNARGSTEVIVATIGLSWARSARTSHDDRRHGGRHHMAMPPTLRWALAASLCARRKRAARARGARGKRLRPEPRAPAGRGRRQRERKFASRVAGMIAGTSMPDHRDAHYRRRQDRTAKAGRKAGQAELGKTDRTEEIRAQEGSGRQSQERQKRKSRRQRTKKNEKNAEQAGETVKEAAEQIRASRKREEKVDTPVDVTTIVHEAPRGATSSPPKRRGST